MGLLNKIFNKKPVLEQNLDEKDKVVPGMIFTIQLLFEEPCEMPDKDFMTSVMEKHLGEAEYYSYDEKMAGFSANKYLAEFSDAKVPPLLSVMGCDEFDGSKIGVLERSNMWNCKNSEELLESCKYQVFATDMMAAALHYKERAELDMDFLEALVEMFPTCKAVYFQNCGKLFEADAIRNHDYPRDERFIYFAVNVRFFNIQGTEEMVVDSLGMSTLFLPDVQYHFHGMDQNLVVDHAYNVLCYIYDNECPIESGECIDGIVDGKLSQEVMWKCQYEQALIQPVREVLDICMNKYAAGGRE